MAWGFSAHGGSLGEGYLDGRQYRSGRRDVGDRNRYGLCIGQGDGVSAGVGDADGGGDVADAVRYGGYEARGGVEVGDGARCVAGSEGGRGDGTSEDVAELVEAYDGGGDGLAGGDEGDGSWSSHVVVSFVEMDFDAVEVGVQQSVDRGSHVFSTFEASFTGEAVEFVELEACQVDGEVERVVGQGLVSEETVSRCMARLLCGAIAFVGTHGDR